MLNLLFKLKNFYLTLKKNYYSVVIREPKSIYYRYQKISYKEQNILGLIQGAFSTVWLLLLFSMLFKDIIYIYLTFLILFCGVLLYLFITYAPMYVPSKFLATILSLSFFYNSESEISNIFIYAFFLVLILINICFGFKTYIFIRFLFFFRCFLAFIYFFYQAFPNMQINIIKNNLIIDLQLLDVLHPMELLSLDNFILLNLKNNKITKTEADIVLNRYKSLQKRGIKQTTIAYERKIENGQIIIYDYENIIEGINLLLDKIEKDQKALKN